MRPRQIRPGVYLPGELLARARAGWRPQMRSVLMRIGDAPGATLSDVERAALLEGLSLGAIASQAEVEAAIAGLFGRLPPSWTPRVARIIATQ